MVQILPFAGWRYDLSQVGALSEVTAPPLMIVDETLQRILYRQHPCNAIRLVMNREEPGDSSSHDRSWRADEFWRLWKREGILLHEHENAMYIVETTFQMAGQERARWSVLCRLSLTQSLGSEDETVRALVQSTSQEIARATELRRICRASLTPAVALLTDVTGQDSDPRSLSDHFENVVRQTPPVECIEDDGTRHRVWPMTNQSARTELTQRLAMFSICIIGGAAEYQAAQATKDLSSSEDPNNPERTTLVCLIPADDPGVEFLPHVLLQPVLSSLTTADVQRILSAEFNCQTVGNEITAGEDAAELAGLNAQQPCLALGTPDGWWMIVSPQVTNSPMPSTDLVQKVSQLIIADGASSGAAVTQRLPLSGRDFGKFLQQLKSKGLLIVEAAWSAPDLVARGVDDPLLPEGSVRLHPSVPTGLVYSDMG
jgi:hypothetical protein